MLAHVARRPSLPSARPDPVAPRPRPRAPRRATAFVGLALALALLPSTARAQTAYTLVDLTVGSPFEGTTANGINAAGHVTGYGVVPVTGEIHAFIDRGGVFEDLGLLGYQASDGIAINDADQLAVDGIGPGSTALFDANGQAHRLGSVDGGCTSAYAINGLGDVVGSAKNGDGNTVGFAWLGGVFDDLTAAGVIRALGINDARQIVGSTGYYWSYGGFIHSALHAVRYAGGVLTDLGSLTGDPRTDSEANAINRAGTIVGYSTAADGLHHAFASSGGTMTDLGTLGGANASAIAINDSGVVIGNLTNAYGANLGAFVVTDGVMADLGELAGGVASGWSQLVVTGLNDAGAIVGYGTLDGGTQGFVAYPASAAGVGPTATVARSSIASVGPNPFRSSTQITVALSRTAAAASPRLEVFDAAGRRVATLMERTAVPGPHPLVWDGRSESGAELPSGVYLARLSTRDGVSSRRLVLLR